MNNIQNDIEVDLKGTIWFWKDNILHNEEGPAMLTLTGVKRYYIDGLYYTEQEFIEWKLKKLLK